jgi:cobalamin synthase
MKHLRVALILSVAVALLTPVAAAAINQSNLELSGGRWWNGEKFVAITTLSGLYYFRRIGGATGDGFGATNQLTEIAVYFCGVWSV